MRGSLGKIITDIEEFSTSEDKDDLAMAVIENKVKALRLFLKSLTPEGIMLEALEAQRPLFEGSLTETSGYSGFRIERMQIGKSIACNYVTTTISPARIEILIYENMSHLSWALSITFDHTTLWQYQWFSQ